MFLPKHVVPRRYEIELFDIDMVSTFTCESQPLHTHLTTRHIPLTPPLFPPDPVAVRGRQTIRVDIPAPTRTIVLHSHQLSVSDVSVTHPSLPKPLEATGIAFDLVLQTVTLTFPSDLPATADAAAAALSMSFRGTLNDELAGFYRSKYTVKNGSGTETRYMAVTQFEATDARRCFPCVDEPAAKAVFRLTVEAPADRTVVTNMHAVRVDTVADGKRRRHTFADTPVMSTYLVGVFVGEFDSVSTISPRLRIPITIYGPLGKADQLLFALRTNAAAIDLLQSFFNVPYLGSKLDWVGIPDFAAGAMENVGAVSAREAALLIDEKESSLATRQRVAQITAHELAHQWFGNHTTMQWWTGLWLNEGFAKWMEYCVTSVLFPEWNVWSTFTAQVQAHAFSLDSLASTHPIEVEVRTPDEINSIFDTVSYMKGASVIRMLFAWIGQETGFRGLSAYLTKHAFANTVTTDLWEALSAASGQDVATVMRKWTGVSGFPYVHVAPNGSGGFTLSSRRFIASWARSPAAWPTDADFPAGAGVEASSSAAAAASSAPASSASSLDTNDDWCIPLSVATATSPSVSLGILALDGCPDASARAARLAASGATLASAVASSPWFKLNGGHTAFHRTVYDPALVRALAPAVATPPTRAQAPALSTPDRIGLVGDVASSVGVGMLPASVLVDLLPALTHEAEYSVWVAVLDAVGDLRASTSALGPDALAAFDAFTRALLAPVVAFVGWDPVQGEHPNTPLLRALVIRLGAIAGMDEVVREALARFDAHAAGKGGLSADMKQVVFNTAASHGGAARWEVLLRLFRAATMSEEQRRLMTALGRAADPALLSRALAMVLTDEIRSQDAMMVFGAVASNPGEAGTALAWRFLVSNWDAINRRLGSGNFVWSGLIGAATGHFATRAAADDIEAWFRDHPAGSAERTVKQSLEAIRTRAWKVHLLTREADWAGCLARAAAAAAAAATVQ